MSEFTDRLWPEITEQPKWEVSINDEQFTLLWSNTWVQFYRTGDPGYDEGLRKYDHVVHKYNEYVDDEGQKKSEYIILSFDQIGPDGLDLLCSSGYPQHTDPIPDNYILTYIAEKEAQSLPETIGPDFGPAAA